MPRMVLQQISRTPRVYLADDFASASELAHALEIGRDSAAVQARGLRTKHDHTGFSFHLPIQGDPVLEALRARLHDAFGLQNMHGSVFRFRRYQPGEAHPPHLDCYEIDGSHLVLTALLNLVDCAGGGATIFPRARPAPLAVDPRRGRLIAWFNYTTRGSMDPRSFHQGALVTAGEKVTLAAFIYRPLKDARKKPPFLSRT